MWHFLAHWFGLDNASGGQYLFWSGFFGDLAIFGTVIAVYWHHTCHVSRCLRLGPHPVDGTPFKTCKTHHPKIDHTNRVTAETVNAAHEDRWKL